MVGRRGIEREIGNWGWKQLRDGRNGEVRGSAVTSEGGRWRFSRELSTRGCVDREVRSAIGERGTGRGRGFRRRRLINISAG